MMPLHRRVNAHLGGSSSRDDGSKVNDSSSPPRLDKTHEGGKTAAAVGKRNTMLFRGLVLAQMILLAVVAFMSRIRSKWHLVALLATVWATSLPCFLILAVGLGVFDASSQDLPHQRYIPLAVMATVVGNQLPGVLSSGMAAAGMLIFGLSSRPKPISEPMKDKDSSQLNKKPGLSGPIKAVLAVILLTTVLLTENFFIWVVSATYFPSHVVGKLPEPLQDNGQIILRHFLNNVLDLTKRDIVKLRGMINVEWILVSGLGMSLVAIEMQGTAMKRNLWSLALRGVLTLTIARAIRTISFLITVLPSQNPRCYFSHFPVPPPQEWSEWLLTGFIPQANGGCNDLIISGHATVTSTIACVVVSIVGKPLFTSALWTLVAIDYMVEVYEGFHYSVDMWLGAIIVNFIWTVLAKIEESHAQELQGAPARHFYALGDAKKAEWIKFSIPVFVAYIQTTGMVIPADKANYTILAFIIAVIYQIRTAGFQQYTQHCIFSLLYMALGIYL